MKEKDIQRETSQIVKDVLEKTKFEAGINLLFWAFLLVR